MPLEIWILLMTFFNVFLVITYLYYRTLHLSSKTKFERSVESLERKIDGFERKVVGSLNRREVPVRDDAREE